MNKILRVVYICRSYSKNKSGLFLRHGVYVVHVCVSIASTGSVCVSVSVCVHACSYIYYLVGKFMPHNDITPTRCGL